MIDLRRVWEKTKTLVGEASRDVSTSATREELLTHVKTLRASLRRMTELSDKALCAIQERLERADDRLLADTTHEMHDVLKAMQRTLQRWGIAQADVSVLRQERAEWLQHAQHSYGKSHEERDERLEMLESELRLRQGKKPQEQEVPAIEQPSVAIEDIALPQTEMIVEAIEDPYEQWTALQPNQEELEQSLLHLLELAQQQGAHPQHAAEYMKVFRSTQVLRKHQDRMNGVTRNRIEIFEN